MEVVKTEVNRAEGAAEEPDTDSGYERLCSAGAQTTAAAAAAQLLESRCQ